MNAKSISSLVLLCVSLTGCPADSLDGPEPQVEFLEPQTPSVYPIGTTTISFDYAVTGIEPGEGYVEFVPKHPLSIFRTRSDDLEGTVTFERAEGWAPGWHRFFAEVHDMDSEPFTNPGASAQTVVYIGDAEPLRPEFLVIEPLDNIQHPGGEPLEVRVGVLGFEFDDDPEVCKAPADCDPFDPEQECMPEDCAEMPVSRSGHVHVLVDCTGWDYEVEIDPSTASFASPHELAVTIPGDELPRPSEESSTKYSITATLHYGDHSPYPNEEHVISETIWIAPI
jgi:hypothetical protein